MNNPTPPRDVQGQMDADLLRRGRRHLEDLLAASEEAAHPDAPLARRVIGLLPCGERGDYIPAEALRVGVCYGGAGLYLIRGRLYVNNAKEYRLVHVETYLPQANATLFPTPSIGPAWHLEFLTRPLQGGPGAWELSG